MKWTEESLKKSKSSHEEETKPNKWNIFWNQGILKRFARCITLPRKALYEKKYWTKKEEWSHVGKASYEKKRKKGKSL